MMFPSESHCKAAEWLNPAIPNLGWVDPLLLTKYFLSRAFSFLAKLAHIPTDINISSKGCIAHARGPHSDFLNYLVVFYLQFKLCVFVGGQEKKLLVSIHRLSKGNFSLGLDIFCRNFFFCKI